MNLPNKLSLIRVALIPVMVALMLPQTTVCNLLAAAVFGVAALTDYLDGHIARSRHLVTDFGKFIDPVADKLLNLSAMIMLVQGGIMPGWAVVLILARELAVDGLRMVAVGQGRVIAAGQLGKIKTVSQMVMLIWLLVTHQPTLTTSAFAQGELWMCVISTILLAWVAVITLWSGVDYFVRNRDCIKDM